jgi:hypothetical protein
MAGDAWRAWWRVLGAQVTLVLFAKNFFLITLHLDPLPQEERGNKRKELLAVATIQEDEK